MNKAKFGVFALLFTVIPHAQGFSAPANITSQPKFKAAEAMFAGKPQESCDILQRSYALDTVSDTDVLYVRGQCLQALGRHKEAIPFYERILQINPKAKAVHLHLAKAYQESGQPMATRQQLETILQSDPPEELAAGVRSALAGGLTEKAWFAFAEAGFIYDSNISAGPSDSQITVFGLPFTLDSASREQGSGGYDFNVSGGYNFKLSDTLGILAQASYAQTDYFKNDTFDSQNLGVSVGPVYRNGPWSVNPNVTASWRALDSKTYSRNAGVNTRVGYVFNNQWLLNATVGWVKNNYVSDNRDGHSLYTNLGANYKVNDDVLLFAGYYVGKDTAKDARFENVRHGPNVGGIAKITPDLTSRLNLSYNYSDYKGADAAFNNKVRNDNVYGANVRFSYDVGQYANIPNLALNLNVGYTHAKSNIEIYSYNRQTTTLSLSKSW